MIQKSTSASQVNYNYYTYVGSYNRSIEEWLEWLSTKSTTKGYTEYGNSGTITYDGSPGRHMKYCLHVKELLQVPSNETKFCWANRYPSGTPYFSVGYNCPYKMVRPDEPSLYELTDSDRSLAWQMIQPSLNTGMSLANFLIELKDIPQLFKLSWSILMRLRKIDWTLFGTKSLAELHLANSFGLQPLIGDIKKLVELLRNLEQRTDDFIAEGKVIQPYHYKRVITDEFTKTYKDRFPGYILRGTTTTQYATLWASYVYDRITIMESFMRVTGLRFTPEVLWNATPFSFVADWMFHIGDALRYLDKDPNMHLKLNAYCDTVKTVTYEKQILDMQDSLYAQGQGYYLRGVIPLQGASHADGTTVCAWTRSIYHRNPNLPFTGFALPASDSLSARELVLGGALLRARIKGDL